MSKTTNTEIKPKSLTFEINPQLFWTIITAIIGVTFFLGFNFGKQKSTKEIADTAGRIDLISRDTQNVYNRVIDSLRVRVTFLDTETDSKRVSQLRNQLKEFKFIKTERFGIDENLGENIKQKPAVLIAHWHAYRTTGNNAHDEASEKELLNTIQQYAEINPGIKVIVFSSVFDDKSERERLTSIKIPLLQNPVSAYPLHPDDESEIAMIVGKVLSTSVARIRNFTD
jgi:hypothetical protein